MPKEIRPRSAVSGPGVTIFNEDSYRTLQSDIAKASNNAGVAVGLVLPAIDPYVRMSWTETAREATNDWPGKVIPWLDSLSDGRPLRLVLGFDS